MIISFRETKVIFVLILGSQLCLCVCLSQNRTSACDPFILLLVFNSAEAQFALIFMSKMLNLHVPTSTDHKNVVQKIYIKFLNMN